MVGEVFILNLGRVVHIYVITMEAPADDFAEVDLRAPAFAIGSRMPPASGRQLDLDCTLLLGHLLLLMALVVWAGTKFDRAIAVVISIHRQATDAFALLPALVAVTAHIAKMLMRGFVAQIFDSVGFRNEPPTYASAIRFPIICSALMKAVW